MAALVVTALLTLGAAKKSKQPSADCLVTSTWPDGTTEKRVCYVMDATSKDALPGTKGVFESCTA